MFKLFKRKKKDAGFPSNELEKSIADAVEDPQLFDIFYTKLLWTELIVLTDGAEPQKEGENTIVKFVTLESGHIPIFSSLNRIYDKGIIKDKVPFVALKGQDLFDIAKDVSFILNPYSDFPKEFLPEEINDILDGTIYEKLKQMPPGLSQKEAQALHELFKKAIKRQENLIYLDGFKRKPLDQSTKKKLHQSISEFDQIVEKCPDHWQSMFGKAKALQRLGEHAESLKVLELALEIEEHNPALALEASVEAVSLRNLDKALHYSEEAIKRAPDDCVLWGNYALNLLVAGQEAEAIAAIDKGMELNSKDEINLNINKLINQVASGERKRPTFDELLK